MYDIKLIKVGYTTIDAKFFRFLQKLFFAGMTTIASISPVSHTHLLQNLEIKNLYLAIFTKFHFKPNFLSPIKNEGITAIQPINW